MIPSIIAIGSNDRAGTKSERQYILNYLEEKYEGSKFELINLQFKNEELTGWDHMFEFNTFKWNNFEATYKDENGVVFKVYGYNEGFNNITSVVDDYFVIKTVNECYQYDNKVYDISTGIQDSINHDWSDYYISLYYHVNYKNISKENYDIAHQLIYINNIKNEILNYKLTDDVRIYVYYEFQNEITLKYKNGEILEYKDGDYVFNYGEFEFDKTNTSNSKIHIEKNSKRSMNGTYMMYVKSDNYVVDTSGIIRNYDEYTHLKQQYKINRVTDTKGNIISENLLETSFKYNNYIYYLSEMFNCKKEIIGYNIKSFDKKVDILFNVKRSCGICGSMPILYVIPILNNSIDNNSEISIDYEYFGNCDDIN